MDLRLFPAAASAWGTAAAVTRLDTGAAFALAGVLGVSAALCLMAVLYGCRQRWVLFLLVPLAVGALVCLPAAASIAQWRAGPVSEAIAEESVITARMTASTDARAISADRFSGAERYLVAAVLTQGTYDGQRFDADTPILVIGPASWGQVRLGDGLRTAGRLLASDPGDRAAALLMARTAPDIQEAGGWTGLTGKLRSDFRRITDRHSPDGGGLLAGMVIGDRSGLDPLLGEAMKSTGLTHLTAVSGANCAYLLAFIVVCARSLRLPRAAAAGAGVVALAAFVLLVRPDPSVLRAAVMGTIGVFAVFLGRGRIALSLLFLTVVVLLAADPWLHSSFAFILSVAATSGLVLFGPVLAARLGRWMPRTAAQMLAVPIAAQVFCAPVLVLLQPSLPMYSIPANLLAAPVVPAVTILGMLAMIPVAVFPPAAVPLVAVAGWGAAWVAAVARFLSAAPAAELPWPGGLPGAAAVALLSLAIVGGVVFLPRIGRTLRRQRTPGSAALLWLGFGCALGLTTVFLWPAPGPLGDWQLAACDVGQGDGFVIRTSGNKAMVIDAGPDPAKMDDCLDTLQVSAVELLVLTHLHQDHYGGVEGVYRGRAVERMLYSTVEKTLPPEVAGLLDGRPAGALSAGMSGSLGAVSWTALWPRAGTALSENDASGVLLVRVQQAGSNPVDILFTGDIEERSAAGLLRGNPQLTAGGVDILKVAHHGARDGGTEVVRALNPRLAMISVGRKNDYGHPHGAILNELEASGVAVARTDVLGPFIIAIEDGSLVLRRMGGKLF